MAKTFSTNPAKIKVIGCGGGGCNAISRMVQAGIQGVEFISMNTDAQALALCEAPLRIQLGERLTRGLGAGGDHILGQKAAEESRDEVKQVLAGADMVFVTAGMGGGTGTGSAPLVAEIAKQNGALTIAVITKPFTFEGAHRRKVAEEGINNLLANVDTLIIIPNDRLLDFCDRRTGVDAAFKLADDVLRQGVQAITEVITVPGLINLDFADVRAVMQDAGPAWMATGVGVGQNRAVEAAREALFRPLLDVSAVGAKGVLFNIIGGSSLTLFEVNEAAEVIRQAVDPEANIIFGMSLDHSLDKEVRITIIATGFTSAQKLVSSAKEEEEFSKFLAGVKQGEDELDLPSYLRRPMLNQRRQAVVPPVKLDKIASETQ